MNHYRNLSMSTMTEPYKTPSKSKELKTNSASFQKEQMNNKDFNDAIELASFIGLSPVNRVKRRTSSKVQTFLKTNNFFMPQQNTINSHKIIKNDLTNRQLNFFDLQKILNQKRKRLIFQKANSHIKQNSHELKIEQNIKQNRAHSERLFRCVRSSQIKQISTEKLKNNLKNKLQIQTAREIQKKQKQRSQRNIEIQKHLQKMHRSLLKRSKLLKQTFQNTIFQNPQNSSILLKQKISKNKFKVCKKISVQV